MNRLLLSCAAVGYLGFLWWMLVSTFYIGSPPHDPVAAFLWTLFMGSALAGVLRLVWKWRP